MRACGVQAHRDTDELRAKPAGEHAAVRIEPAGVDSGHESAKSRLVRERLACVEETFEPLRCSFAGSNRGELDVAGISTRLASWSAVAHGHSLERLPPAKEEVSPIACSLAATISRPRSSPANTSSVSPRTSSSALSRRVVSAE